MVNFIVFMIIKRLLFHIIITDKIMFIFLIVIVIYIGIRFNRFLVEKFRGSF